MPENKDNKVVDAAGNTVELQGIYQQGTERLLAKFGSNLEMPFSNRVLMGTGTGNSGWRKLPASALAFTRYIECIVVAPTTSVATGDGKFYFHIPTDLNSWNLAYVHALVVTAGTTGTTDIQIANVTDSVDMLSTKLTIDSGETGSNTAATAAVIDTTKDDVATNDVIRIDVDAISTTAPKGLIITLGFKNT